MIIIGCEYHPGFQQIAFVDSETGALQERRLQHPEEAEKFYNHLITEIILLDPVENSRNNFPRRFP
jgi:transposase